MLVTIYFLPLCTAFKPKWVGMRTSKTIYSNDHEMQDDNVYYDDDADMYGEHFNAARTTERNIFHEGKGVIVGLTYKMASSKNPIEM